ncbi:hypothetical protein AAD018_018375 [Aestuariibius insulae]|uniref:hypothetical protein n=1 Tax=Aestuariibius insulae TaxID=2058287 RepID=UPI00345EEACE
MSKLHDLLLSADYRTAPWFAVLDGAQFDNLPDALREGKFIACSLYLDRGENNPEQVITAPHLVVLDETAHNPALRPPAEAVPALLDLIKDRPAAVFWQCPKGEDALFKHLRGINMVMYPKELLPPLDPEVEADSDEMTSTEEAAETHARVLFRHADADVMAQVGSSLTMPNQARLLGPASALLFQASAERGGLLSVVMDAGVPAAPGPLRLSEAELSSLDGSNAALSRARIETHLREVAPEYVDVVGSAGLSAVVQQAEQTGGALGIETEYGQGLWATLMLMTGGELANEPQVVDYVKDHSEGPDRAVEEILEQIGAASDEDWEAL